MDISPIILRMHPELDPEQQRVVAHGPGPMLAIAGPGSGKTLCVELRTLNLLLTGQAGPGDIVLCNLRPGRRPRAASTFHQIGPTLRHRRTHL